MVKGASVRCPVAVSHWNLYQVRRTKYVRCKHTEKERETTSDGTGSGRNESGNNRGGGTDSVDV